MPLRFISIRCFSCAAAVAAACFIAACAHTEPTWVTEGSHAIAQDSGQVVYGVGVARGIRNRAHARTVAENRARQRALALVRSGSGQGIILSGRLRGIQIIDHWEASDGRVFALAEYRP